VPHVQRTALHQVLAKHSFSTPYLFDVCVCAGASVNESRVDYERLFSAALAKASNQPPGEEGAQGARTASLAFFVLDRLLKVVGNLSEVLRNLNAADHEATGLVTFDHLSRALQCSKKELTQVVPDDGSMIQYEALLGSYAAAFSLNAGKIFAHQKVRRAAKRCELVHGVSLGKWLFSHDEEKKGWVTIHQLSWELRMLQVYLECEGYEADYLLGGFKGSDDAESQAVDYERLLLEIAMEDALTFDERRRVKQAFVTNFFNRCLSLPSRYIGMFHVLDSAWDVLDDTTASGLCSTKTFEFILREAFGSATCNPAKLDFAIRCAVELFTFDQTSEIRYEDFANTFSQAEKDPGAPEVWTQDKVRHAVVYVMRRAFSSVAEPSHLYDQFRARDGDLDGRISMRETTQIFARMGCKFPEQIDRKSVV
jgi:hypothetical protein